MDFLIKHNENYIRYKLFHFAKTLFKDFCTYVLLLKNGASRPQRITIRLFPSSRMKEKHPELQNLGFSVSKASKDGLHAHFRKYKVTAP